MSDDAFEFKDFGLEKLVKLLTDKDAPKVKIGILGDKNSREGDGGNADIGMKHEFGKDGMPVRSFLRMPLITKMQDALDNSNAMDEAVLKKVLKEGSEKWLGKIGALGESVVADAFDTGGFGEWKESNMKYKKVHQTLVETQQLRNSITSVVVKD